MKKIITAVLALLLVLGLLSPLLNVFALEKSAGLSESGITEIVGALGIMQGDGYGNLNLENRVTRAEFVKMAVCASVYKDDSGVRPSYSLFPDVSASHWCSGYIKTALDAGFVNGYIDGTFRPSAEVKLEEAVNVVLKLLGYTPDDFSGIWPSGQMAKYKNLKLDTSVCASEGDHLTRRDCMYLIYNTLCTQTKDGTAYAKTLGYDVDENGNIDYAALIDDEKEGPFVVADVQKTVEELSQKGYIAYKDGKSVSLSVIKKHDVLYYAPAFRTVWIYDDKLAGILEEFYPNAKSPEKITVSGVTYTLSEKNSVKSTGFSKNEPVVVLVGEGSEAAECYKAAAGFVADNLTDYNASDIYLNGGLVKSEEIKNNSLIYVSDALSSVFCYDSSVSGVVTDVLPSKQKPETVTVGGQSYALCDNVKADFENGQDFAKNDFVTLYLGSGGKVEYAVHADIYDAGIYRDNGLSYDSLVSMTLEGPVIANGDAWKNELDFPAESASFYQNGRKVDADAVRDYDVLYHSATFRTVWIYSDRVTGVVEQIKPNAVTPSSVVVAGSEYALETADAAIAFSAQGQYSEGETVTLLIGKDGVCEVEDPGKVSQEYVGIITDITRKENTSADGKTKFEHYLTISSFDGRTHLVKTEKDYLETGKCITLSYNESTVNIKYLNTKYADISRLKETIKSGKVSPDAVIVDCYKTNFAKTYISRLSEISLEPSDVIYYNINKEGYLDYLVLDDATGDIHSYGIIVRYGNGYRFFTSAKNNSISDYSIPALGGVGVKYNDGSSFEMETLREIELTSIDGKTARYGGLSYKIWDYCEYYNMTQKSFVIESGEKVSDVINACSADFVLTALAEGAPVRAYVDKTGTVRVIVSQKR